MKYLIYITAVIVTAVLVNRYNRISWWIACIASAIFALLALVIGSPIIFAYFVKDTILTMVYAIREDIKE